MESKQVQLYLDREKMIEASPVTSAECVILSDGNDLQKVLDNDLTNPTVVHEETSFKVGVGDINVSSSVVDGEVGRMVIKGKTYQNILPEPSTHVLTNNKEMFKVNEGLDPNVEIVDGVSKSAILKGQTLVNLFEKTGVNVSNPPYLTVNGSITQLKANTVYTIKYFNLPIEKVKQLRVVERHGDYNDTPYVVSEIGKFTTKTDFSDFNRLIIQVIENENGSISEEELSRVKIALIEGDYTNVDIPYFTGMQSVKMPVLTTTGKNLFDVNKGFTTVWQCSYTIGSDGSITIKPTSTSGVSYIVTETIELEVGKTYRLTWNETGNTRTSYMWLEGTTNGGVYNINKPFTVQEGKNRVRLAMYVDNTSLNNTVTFKPLLEQGTSATTYEPYKTNILTVNEEVELRGIGDVKDELNLITGEMIENFESFTFNGSENWALQDDSFENTTRFILKSYAPNRVTNKNVGICNNFAWGNYDKDFPGIVITKPSGHVYLRTPKMSVDELKTMLSNNPIHGYYNKEKSIKTVDLSTSGNWEKVILDGSENWLMTNNTHFYTKLSNELSPNALLPIIDNSLFTPKDNSNSTANAVWYGGNVGDKNGNIVFNVLDKTLEQFKQYLSQNPITVWYQTTNHKDSTQVKQPIFFKDGHIQLSSGADNSLIPTLDYQAKTSNSYVMDLMKTNTKYTMKAKSASGTFTIDGTSYGAGTNGTFTTPTSMTNKLLVMSDTAHEEVMILEGDVTDKTIPYFKGIKSAFEDEDKIEVLSTGKNLFKQKLTDYDYLGNYAENETIIKDDCIEWNATTSYKGAVYYYINVKPNTKYTLSLQRNIQQTNCVTIYDGFVTSNVNNIASMGANKNSVTFNTKSDKITIRFSNGTILDTLFKIYDVQIEESPTATSYEPYKSNSTKIPLLSPLRSLPNGVCDELIIDRMKKKATLIQRVGYGVLGRQGHGYNYANSSINTNLYQPWYTKDLGDNVANSTNANTMLCDKLLVTYENYTGRAKESIGMYPDKSANFTGCLLKTTLGAKTVKQWFEANEVSVYYQLETPVVTEIDLENFPLVYKDGHIFLNSEIAPMVEINYNENQSQQIQANNETLQRHELDILDLDNLIVSFVNAEYNLRLLKFNMELSMMALAE